MTDSKIVKIDFGQKRLQSRIQSCMDSGDVLSALRLLKEECDRFGETVETDLMISDIYEEIGVYPSAVNALFKLLDKSDEEDYPDVYEGLAVNYYNMGNENQSAYYYNLLMDTDDTLTDDDKEEIAEAFSEEKKPNLKFAYPPEYVDYSKETESGLVALKCGQIDRALDCFKKVEKGSKEYLKAQDMSAVAYLLEGNVDKAEEVCQSALQEDPENVQLLATLSAVYTEQGRDDESKEICLKLINMKVSGREDKYKIATVACENGLHESAYQLFLELTKDMPYDGNMLYFKGVSAFLSGREEESKRIFETLITVYPDAMVADYYLRAIRAYESGKGEKPELTYFYKVPDEEKLIRTKTLTSLSKMKPSEAKIVGQLLEKEGYFTWCFDEMDGKDLELQFSSLIVAEKIRLDDFLRKVLLDYDVRDVLKIELLKLLFMRNEENRFGVVLNHIYEKITTEKLKIGRKKHTAFLTAYAMIASRFALTKENGVKTVKNVVEKVYKKAEDKDLFPLIKEGELLCVVYLLSGFTVVGKSSKEVAKLFGANRETVDKIMSEVLSY